MDCGRRRRSATSRLTKSFCRCRLTASTVRSLGRLGLSKPSVGPAVGTRLPAAEPAAACSGPGLILHALTWTATSLPRSHHLPPGPALDQRLAGELLQVTRWTPATPSLFPMPPPSGLSRVQQRWEAFRILGLARQHLRPCCKPGRRSKLRAPSNSSPPQRPRAGSYTVSDMLAPPVAYALFSSSLPG